MSEFNKNPEKDMQGSRKRKMRWDRYVYNINDLYKHAGRRVRQIEADGRGTSQVPIENTEEQRQCS